MTHSNLCGVSVHHGSQCRTAGAGGQVRRHVTTRAGTEVELKADAVRVTLEPVAPPPGAQAMSLKARVAEFPANRRLFLIVKDLRARPNRHVLYHVYLEAPSDAAPDRMVQHHVGAVNFFNAVRHGMGAGGHAPQRRRHSRLRLRSER